MLQTKLFLLLLLYPLIFFSQATLTVEELNYIKKNPIVRFSYDPEWKPIGFTNEKGKFDGISKDVLDLIAQQSGLKLKLEKRPDSWKEALQAMRDGKIDLLPAMAMNPERLKFIDFSTIYMSYKVVIVNKKGGMYVEGISNLNGHRVAVTANSYVAGIFKEAYPEVILVELKGLEECMAAVMEEKVDAAVGNMAVISYYLNYDGFNGLKVATSVNDLSIKVRFGIAKGNDTLLNIINKCLSNIEPQTINQLKQKWVSVKVDHGVNMKKVWTISSIVAGGLLSIIGVFFYFNRKLQFIVRKKSMIQRKLKETLSEVKIQNNIIQEKNKAVLASINYAKRLQSAIIPKPIEFKENFSNYFVFFKPKDIVSGDFYWLEQGHNAHTTYFAVADCTGHGVPGAMVSLVCFSGLKKSLYEYKIESPSEILDATRVILEETFSKQKEEVINDGMDISLAAYNRKNRMLHWTGANNGLFLVRKNDKIELSQNQIKELENIRILNGTSHHIVEFKADRQAVGKNLNSKKFSQTSIQLSVEDRIYMITDGFVDQFGGEQGKKYKVSQFRDLLLNIQHYDLRKQLEIIDDVFDHWKRDYEQIDDVCVLGVEV